MATNKNSSLGAIFGGIIIGIVLGVVGLYAYNAYAVESTSLIDETDPAAATVSKKNGLFVFINSRPQKPTESLGTYSYSLFDRALDILNTKGENAMDEPNQVLNMIVIDKRLDEITSDVSNQYPDAECVIFTGNLNNCEVCKFAE